MVRFRVIKASRLLLGAAVVALALMVCLLALRMFSASGESTPAGGASQQGAEAALAAFAAPAQNAQIEITVLEPSASGQASCASASPCASPTSCASASPSPTPAPAAVRVLIYHTHTHEAYEQVAEAPYEAVEAWRTEDEAHSVVRVGAELALLLRRCGLEVVHDVTDHELDDLSTAYERSLTTLESYDQPFDLYIDLHRDAYVEGETLTVDNDGVECARLMLLVGSGERFEVKPRFEENLAFATALTQRLNDLVPGICRDVQIKDNRYNQHVGSPALLIEVGNNRNTLAQAVNAMAPLSQALYQLLVHS